MYPSLINNKPTKTNFLNLLGLGWIQSYCWGTENWWRKQWIWFSGSRSVYTRRHLNTDAYPPLYIPLATRRILRNHLPRAKQKKVLHKYSVASISYGVIRTIFGWNVWSDIYMYTHHCFYLQLHRGKMATWRKHRSATLWLNCSYDQSWDWRALGLMTYMLKVIKAEGKWYYMKSTARGSECRHIGTSSAELQSLHELFPRGEDEMKAHITGRHWTCMVIRSSGRLKLGWFDWRLSISQGYASGYPSSPHLPFPPSGSQQEHTLNHFVLYLEKLSDRSFCGQDKSISSCYRAKNILFLSCWLCTFWTVMALVDRHHGRITPGDK